MTTGKEREELRKVNQPTGSNVPYVIFVLCGACFLGHGLMASGPYPANYHGYWYTEYPDKQILLGVIMFTVSLWLLLKKARRE